MATKAPPRLALVGSISPPCSSRAWQTAVHPRLPLLATCNADRAVAVSSLTSFAQVSSITGGHKRSIRTVAWKPGHEHDSVLATGSFDASVGIWRQDDDEGRPKAEEMDFTGEAGDGGGEEDEDEEWRFALVLDGHDSEVKSVAWSAGGNLLATCSRDKSVWIWEEVGEDDFETIAVLQEHSADVKCVAWHPDEELLASGSYDDEVRLWREDVDDWDCVAVLRGHESTVWCLEFEGLKPIIDFAGMSSSSSEGRRHEWTERREKAGARLASAGDDRTIRIWRRIPRERKPQNSMSIIRTGSIEETWVEETTLPVVHEGPIYSVAWSRRTGYIASTGADGKIVIYEERWKEEEQQEDGRDPGSGPQPEAVAEDATAQADQLDGSGGGAANGDAEQNASLDRLTGWSVLVELDGAHGVYELNHVAWAKRADRGKRPDEEVVVSTGDDGHVKVWSIER